MALECLKQITSSLNIELKPSAVMTDFEKALRNALSKSFPKAKLSGCYFHFTKCLWEKFSKLGLRTKDFKRKSRLLISFFQVIAHCPVNLGKSFFNEVKDIFKTESDRFQPLFTYFKNIWLSNGFLDELVKAVNSGNL